MKDEKQFVLFFANGLKIDNTQLAAELAKEFPQLGQPAVFPFDRTKMDRPLIIFNQGKLKLNVTVSEISFIYNSEDHSKMLKEVKEIIEFFEDEDFSFERMGYISTILHTKKEKNKFKENVFKDKNLVDSEFQLSWYKKELIDSVSVNVWEREMTDILNNVELVSIFDINTPIDEVYNITSDFVYDFAKQCDKYIENKDKLLKE